MKKILSYDPAETLSRLTGISDQLIRCLVPEAQPGMLNTPSRVARARMGDQSPVTSKVKTVFPYTPDPPIIVKVDQLQFTHQDKPIQLSVQYTPKENKLLGLSKFARLIQSYLNDNNEKPLSIDHLQTHLRTSLSNPNLFVTPYEPKGEEDVTSTVALEPADATEADSALFTKVKELCSEMQKIFPIPDFDAVSEATTLLLQTTGYRPYPLKAHKDLDKEFSTKTLQFSGPSTCEHHLYPFNCPKIRVTFANETKIKVGSIATIIATHLFRFQTQENLTQNLFKALNEAGYPAIVSIEDSIHTCMSERGVLQPVATTSTYISSDPRG